MLTDTPTEIAERWRRVVARAIDLVVLTALVAGALFVAHRLGFEFYPVTDAIIFVVLLAYEVAVPTLANGSSLGRRIVQIHIVSEAGRDTPGFLRCFGRFMTRVALYALFAVFVAYELSFPVFIAVLLLEGLVGALQRRRQTLADLVGRTLVIKNIASTATAV